MCNDYEIFFDVICIVIYVNLCSDMEGYYNINNNKIYMGNKLGKEIIKYDIRIGIVYSEQNLFIYIYLNNVYVEEKENLYIVN